MAETPDIQLAALTVKVDAMKATLDSMSGKLDTALALQARHDEQIKSIQTRGTWVGGIFAAALAALLKDKLGL